MQIFAERALLRDGWRSNVLIEVDAQGLIAKLVPNSRPPAGAERAAGAVLPGMPNLHSHAFQRAFAGYTETRSSTGDDFWTWRSTMYAFLARIDPDALQAIATQLYIEMLRAGYTSVGEFHYLHHDPSGSPYASLTETSDRIIAAAREVGIAITHLPVLYAHGGFGGAAPVPGQRRFVSDLDRFTELLETLYRRYAGATGVRIGIAPHSLRAVTPPELTQAVGALDRLDPRAPIHIHVAEQIGEVDDCLAVCGARPVALLFESAAVDRRWCLVHATHIDESELHRILRHEPVIGLCPITEANLGDGISRARELLSGGGRFGIGSDSNTRIDPGEELRVLEYGQRLFHRRRALLAEPGESVGMRLYTQACRGGAEALANGAGELAPGRRADLVVLDESTPILADRPSATLLDAMVFGGEARPVKDVMVGGVWRIRDRRHPIEEEVFDRFRSVHRRLWQDRSG
jgi:formimidoylglutamate deiminase